MPQKEDQRVLPLENDWPQLFPQLRECATRFRIFVRRMASVGLATRKGKGPNLVHLPAGVRRQAIHISFSADFLHMHHED